MSVFSVGNELKIQGDRYAWYAGTKVGLYLIGKIMAKNIIWINFTFYSFGVDGNLYPTIQ